MKPGSSTPHSQGSQIIPNLSRINPIPRIDNYFFTVHSNIPPLNLSLPEGIFHISLPVNFFLNQSTLHSFWQHDLLIFIF